MNLNPHRNKGGAPWQNGGGATPPWQKKDQNNSNFPVPPRPAGGILGASPGAPPLMSGILNSNIGNRNQPNQHQGPPGLFDTPSQLKNLAPWNQQSTNQEPPSLLDGMLNKPLGIIDNKPLQSFGLNVNNRFQDEPVGRPEPRHSPRHSPQQMRRMNDNPVKTIDQRAMELNVSSQFYEKVIETSNMAGMLKVSAEVARADYYMAKGMPNPDGRNSGQGSHACNACNVKFLSRDRLNIHVNTPQHQEIEDMCNVRKEQARLIKEGRIPRPPGGETSKPNETMIAVARAEVEMNIKPTEMELDPYILGIYESIMKPYWPVPKSVFYCRICNYVEFRSKVELERHNGSKEHQHGENTYGEAFCLYCQIHNVNKSQMSNHEHTQKHKKAKELMENTKKQAIIHWHKVNNMPLPDKILHENQHVGSPKIGSKRNAPEPEYNNATKKIATSKAKDVPKNTNTNVKLNPALADRTKMWFAPINGHICVACHSFVANEKDQVTHVKTSSHLANIDKFKKMLLSER